MNFHPIYSHYSRGLEPFSLLVRIFRDVNSVHSCIVKIFVCLGHASGTIDMYTLRSFLRLDMRNRVILKVKFWAYDRDWYAFGSYKVRPTAMNRTHFKTNVNLSNFSSDYA